LRYSGRRWWVVKSVRNIYLIIRTYIQNGLDLRSLSANVYGCLFPAVCPAYFEGPRPWDPGEPWRVRKCPASSKWDDNWFMLAHRKFVYTPRMLAWLSVRKRAMGGPQGKYNLVWDSRLLMDDS
jgi:hypothetical protein